MGKFPCWQWPVLSYRAASRSQQGQQLFCLREHISGEIREINKVCFEDSAQGERRAPFKAQWQDYSLSMRWAGNQTVSKQNSQKLPDYLSLQARFSFCFLYMNELNGSENNSISPHSCLICFSHYRRISKRWVQRSNDWSNSKECRTTQPEGSEVSRGEGCYNSTRCTTEPVTKRFTRVWGIKTVPFHQTSSVCFT